jgi:tetratricopeptide (TPR) repeat protein
MKKTKLFFLLTLLLVFTGCNRVPNDLEPKINYAVQDRYIKNLPSPFKPLTETEKEQIWSREYQIGIAFAHQLDLYQAMTAFKRAEILAPPEMKERKLEIEYDILLCYYLGGKCSDVTYTFENGGLRLVDQTFPALEDLLVIIYDCYLQLGQDQKAMGYLELIKQLYPETGKKLTESTMLLKGNIPALEEYSASHPQENDLKGLLACYEHEKKSIAKTQALNAFLPGAGYLYLGQRQSAVTAALLNGLFIAASYHFFHRGDIAAGIIFTSFEAGWYFGGIYGGGLEAKYYNERLYEKLASPVMNKNKLFPVLMLRYAF